MACVCSLSTDLLCGVVMFVDHSQIIMYSTRLFASSGKEHADAERSTKPSNE